MTIKLRHVIYGVISLIVLALGIAWSGLINVGASTGHWSITEWFVHSVMRRSVMTQSLGIETPPLDDPAMVRRGAGHYELVCAGCHGSPLRPRDTVVLGMTPTPPDLAGRIAQWTPGQLFWIVKHGVKLTAMPAWPTQERDDEVWSMIAFLRVLPGMNATTYIALAGIDDSATAPSSAALAVCVRCHGADGRGAPDGAFPRLDIQSPEYLVATLRAFRDGRRASGFMQNAVAGLRDDELLGLARHFGRRRDATEPRQPVALDSEPGMPACTACHGPVAPARPEFPSLSGQYESYLRTQLRLFADEERPRGGGPFVQLMHEVIRDVPPAALDELAAWYASQPTR